MPGNAITNAGGVEGVAGWVGSAGSVLAIDDTVRGFDGRMVIRAAKNVALNEVVTLANQPAVAISSDQYIEAFAHHGANRGSTTLKLQIFSDAAATVLLQTIDVPTQTAGDGNPRLGLSKSYTFSHLRMKSPVTGFMRLQVSNSPTSAGLMQVLIMRPYLEAVSQKTKYRCWDPGPHIDPDLNLPHWPSDLPHLRAENFSVPVIPSRVAFSGDKGIAVTKKLTRSPWYQAMGQVRGDQETHAILDQFFRTQPEPFWFVRPDTLQLCRAYWLAEGEPSSSGLGANKIIEFGLQLSII